MLSVIIPVYNVEPYLERCVRSVITQGVDDMEVILVDDGSPDNCPRMCDEWAGREERIKVIHKQNGGLSDARNAGIAASRGEIITFVDSDDEVAPDSYKPLIDFMLSNEECDILEYPVKFIGWRRRREVMIPEIMYDVRSMQDKRDYWLKEQVYRHCFACNKLFRRHLFDDVRFPVGRVFEDVWMLPSLLLRARKVASLNKGCYHYISHDGGISHQHEKIWQLLEAYIHSTQLLGIDIGRDREMYCSVMNVQIDTYRFAQTAPRLLLPFHRFSPSGIKDKNKLLKLLVQNVFGLKFLCRIYRLAYIKFKVFKKMPVATCDSPK